MTSPSPITKVARTFPLKVTITPELHERLRAVAAQLGQAPATVASMAIGQYVSQMQNSLGATERAIDKALAHMAPAAMEQLKLLGNEASKPAKKAYRKPKP